MNNYRHLIPLMVAVLINFTVSGVNFYAWHQAGEYGFVGFFNTATNGIVGFVLIWFCFVAHKRHRAYQLEKMKKLLTGDT